MGQDGPPLRAVDLLAGVICGQGLAGASSCSPADGSSYNQVAAVAGSASVLYGSASSACCSSRWHLVLSHSKCRSAGNGGRSAMFHLAGCRAVPPAERRGLRQYRREPIPADIPGGLASGILPGPGPLAVPPHVRLGGVGTPPAGPGGFRPER